MQKATCIGDLMENPTLSQEHVQKICTSNGDNILFILDGWDELPDDL